MAFVYRSVPMLISGDEMIDDQIANKSIEGACYDLGFACFEVNLTPFFYSCGQFNNTFLNAKRDRNCYHKYFFLFPNDAIMNTFLYNDCYMFDREMFQLLEFNIPDEILIQYCGYGFYDKARVEFCIPENVFEENVTTKKILRNEDLIRNLNASKQYYEHDDEIFMKNFSEAIDIALNRRNRIYACDFITYRRILIYKREFFDFNDQKYIDLSEIISLLNQKGIGCCSDMTSIYSYLAKDIDDVLGYEEKSVKALQKQLPDIFFALSKK